MSLRIARNWRRTRKECWRGYPSARAGNRSRESGRYSLDHCPDETYRYHFEESTAAVIAD